MFGLKKKPVAPEVASVAVSMMPAEFYAGANPVITFKDVPKEIDLSSHQAVRTAPARGGSSGKRSALDLLSNRTFLIGGAAALFVLVAAGASAYYWRQSAGQPKSTPPPATISTPSEPARPVEEIVPTVVTSTPEAAEAEPPAAAIEVLPLAPVPLVFPSPLLGDSGDSDQDALTDREEELFKTDPEVPDTDGDKYTDGQETYNLYNPFGKEPMKIIDSGLVKEYVNQVFSYSVYYPAEWAMGAVDGDGRTALFSTITGENIEVRVADKNASQTFEEWFAATARGEQFGDLISFTSVFKETGFRRKDYLVYYFPTPTRVYALTYHTTDSAVVNFRLVMKMMARSFRLMSTAPAVPARAVEPSATNTTEGGVETPPL